MIMMMIMMYNKIKRDGIFKVCVLDMHVCLICPLKRIDLVLFHKAYFSGSILFTSILFFILSKRIQSGESITIIIIIILLIDLI